MALYRMAQEPQNHLVFVFDESYSMLTHSAALVQLFDNEVQYYAKRSLELNQETRVSVYLFSDPNTARCVLYDTDVVRATESFTLKGKYQPNGMTALTDAVVMAVDDLKKVVHPYGQHSYWVNVFTDGQENASSFRSRNRIVPELRSLPDNWTFSAFVPDYAGKAQASTWGFPPDNISIWDSTSEKGLIEVGKTVRQAANSYFNLRSTGARGSKSLFSLNKLSGSDILSNLAPLLPNQYTIADVPGYVVQIRPFVEDHLGITFRQYHGYYELTKVEHIQASKKIAILYNGRVYTGDGRSLLGLPDYEVKVDPRDNKYKDYKIFVQSGSVNRNLIPGQKFLYIF